MRDREAQEIVKERWSFLDERANERVIFPLRDKIEKCIMEMRRWILEILELSDALNFI